MTFYGTPIYRKEIKGFFIWKIKMSLYKFENNDVLRHRIKTYPESNFFIYEGSMYYNNNPIISGTLTGNIGNIPPGYISLHELNIDRSPLMHTYNADTQTGQKHLIFPFTEKSNNAYDSTFKTVSSASFFSKKPTIDSQGNFILPQITSSYPMSASISVHHYSNNSNRTSSYIDALKNITDYYSVLSPHYQYNSTLYSRDFNVVELCLVDIPKIFYGNRIKKGSVLLRQIITGTLVSELQDINKNGELVQTYGSQNSGTINGIVLYNEGTIILSGTETINSAHTEDYVGTGATTPKWVYFGSSLSGNSTQNTSYELNFKGENTIEVLNMMAHASKNELNHSNNLTYIRSGSIQSDIVTRNLFQEQSNKKIVNLVSSSFVSPTGSFEKITYLSEVGIYDKDKNLIGIAKLATPLKKTKNNSFSLRLKLDIQ